MMFLVFCFRIVDLLMIISNAHFLMNSLNSHSSHMTLFLTTSGHLRMRARAQTLARMRKCADVLRKKVT